MHLAILCYLRFHNVFRSGKNTLIALYLVDFSYNAYLYRLFPWVTL